MQTRRPNHALQRTAASRSCSNRRAPWQPMPGSIYLYVKDTDATYQRALKAGATSVMEPADQFYGDRNAGVKDPIGNMWWIATHIEDISPEEMKKREKDYIKKRSGGRSLLVA